MKRAIATGLALLVWATSSAASASAQRFPGVPGGGGMSSATHRAEYYADVLEHVTELLDAWRLAWAEDAIEDLLELYAEDATFVFGDDDPVVGRGPVGEKLASLLERTFSAQAAFLDFDASGRMAFVSGPVNFEIGDGRRRTVSGIHFTVLLRQGRHWRIRSQWLRVPGTLGAS